MWKVDWRTQVCVSGIKAEITYFTAAAPTATCGLICLLIKEKRLMKDHILYVEKHDKKITVFIKYCNYMRPGRILGSG